MANWHYIGSRGPLTEIRIPSGLHPDEPYVFHTTSFEVPDEDVKANQFIRGAIDMIDRTELYAEETP